MTPRRLTILALAGMLAALAAAALLGQPATHIPAGAHTRCGYPSTPGGPPTLYSLRPEVALTMPNHLSSQLRWGPCWANPAPECGGAGASPKLCVASESERAEIQRWYQMKVTGSCSPPAGTPYPEDPLLTDLGLIVAPYDTATAAMRDWCQQCGVHIAPVPINCRTGPQPQPSPAPAPTPPLPAPSPTAAPDDCPPCPCDDPPQPSARVKQTARVAPTWQQVTPQRAEWLLDLYLWARSAWEFKPCACSTGATCTVVAP